MIRTQAGAESHTPRNRARARALLLAMSLGLCAPAIASGQQFRGALVGTVTDPAGALRPGSARHTDRHRDEHDSRNP